MAARRGAFILFEGVDRCGKSTQASMLLDRLRKADIPCEAMRFPDRTTTIGSMIDGYLRSEQEMDDHAIHLLFSANRWELASKLRTLLEAGTTVVCDRYAYSGVAFSGAKPGMDVEWCKQSDVGLPRPDKVIFLELAVEDAQRRGAYGAERYEKVEMQSRVLNNFRVLREQEGDWLVVDAKRTVEDIHAELFDVAQRVVESSAASPIRLLWTQPE